MLEVLDRPAIRRKYRTIAGDEMVRVLDIIGKAPVVELGEIPPTSRDPAGHKFLATARAARAARANYLVSEDQDLLTLEGFEGTRIVSAAAFLRILGLQEDDGEG